MGGHRPLLEKLFRKYKQKCCYCKQKVVLTQRGDGVNATRFPNSATIEHKYTKLDIRRNVEHRRSRYRLSCYKCNLTRGNENFNSVFNNDMYSHKDFSDNFQLTNRILFRLLNNEVNEWIL